jgi:ABC-type Fe3+-hydroxamate transport system substrate-binding protein
MVEGMNTAMPPGFSPQRVVSLYPSSTDSIVQLGLGSLLVGVTDYCQLPKEYTGVQRIGGPKDARFTDILSLKPEMVIANREENSGDLVREMQEAGLVVWITYPRTIRDVIRDLTSLADLYASETIHQSVVWLERAVNWLQASRPEETVSIFCPIWREGPAMQPREWMTIGRDTYADDLLRLCGAENVFSDRGPERYPKVTPEDIVAARPELILLPDEPFAFQREDISAMASFLPDSVIRPVDGRLVFWHGTMLGESIRALPEIIHSLRRPAA